MSLESLVESARAAETLGAYGKNLARTVGAEELRRLRKLAAKPLMLADVVELLAKTDYEKAGSRGHWDIYSNNGSQMAVMPMPRYAIQILKAPLISKETHALLVRNPGPEPFLPVSEQELRKIESAYRWRGRLNSFTSPLYWLPTAVTLAGAAINLTGGVTSIAKQPLLALTGMVLAIGGLFGGGYLYIEIMANKFLINSLNIDYQIGINAVRGLLGSKVAGQRSHVTYYGRRSQ